MKYPVGLWADLADYELGAWAPCRDYSGPKPLNQSALSAKQITSPGRWTAEPALHRNSYPESDWLPLRRAAQGVELNMSSPPSPPTALPCRRCPAFTRLHILQSLLLVGSNDAERPLLLGL